jgi:hypothetical protein
VTELTIENIIDSSLNSYFEISSPKNEDITLLFTGDFCPHRRIEEYILIGKSKEIYNEFLPILLDKDISITNLECPLTDGNDKIEKVGPNLKASPKCIEALKYAKFDVVSLANNHIMDYGKEGLEDTIYACENEGIETVGAGRNLKEAGQTLYKEVRGRVIAFISIAEHEYSIAEKDKAGANPLEVITNYYKILEAKKNADCVILLIHGGNEYYDLPSPRLISTYRYFADLGVTAVIGHHTHTSGAFEIYHGVPIFYSLGNFIFDWNHVKQEGWYNGYIVKMKLGVQAVNDIILIPYCQNKYVIGLAKINLSELQKHFSKLRKRSLMLQDDAAVNKEWVKYVNSVKDIYLLKYLGLNRAIRFLIRKNIIPHNIFLRKKKVLKMDNLINCESHRDVLIDVFKNYYNRKNIK